MNIEQMAAEMNVSESTFMSFVNCLRVWTDKGFSIEEAIIKHQDIVSRMKANPAGVVAFVKEGLGKQ